MTKTVLVVDDDPSMRHMLADYLADHEFLVEMASDGGEMAQVLGRGPVGLVLLDLKLPDAHGLNLLRTLRSESATPVIVVTGHRREEVDRVVGLELGEDDYLTKPFGLRELLARVRAVMRRSDVGALGGQARDNGDQSTADRTPT